jgi:hypothetical protein
LSHNSIISIIADSVVEYDDKSRFQCQNSSFSIPQEWKCNGHVDCRGTAVSDELNCDKFSFWKLPVPTETGMGISVDIAVRDYEAMGHLAVGLACDVNNYAILVNLDLDKGNLSAFTKQNGKWIQGEDFTLKDLNLTVGAVVQVWAVDKGFEIVVNGHSILWELQCLSCFLDYVVVGELAVKIYDITYTRRSRERKLPLAVVLSSDPIVSKIRTDLEQILWPYNNSVSLGCTCPDPGPFHHGWKSVAGNQMTFSCDPGFELSGPTLLFCESNCKWSGSLPVCLLPPVILEISNKWVTVGEFVQINCVFSGDPIPNITWSKDGHQILPNGLGRRVLHRGLESILVLETVTEDDFGMYQCQVDNRLGSAKQDFWLLKIGNCSVLPLPTHAVIVNGNETRVDYSCEPFYSLSSGNYSRECGQDGHWTGTPPVCHPICGIKGGDSSRVIRDIPHDRSRRIIGGVDSSPGTWPWQVMLEVYGTAVCGGSLVSQWTVVTAAHCLENPEEMIVRIGAHAQNTVSNLEQFDAIEDIVFHPSYKKTKDSKFYYDVALIHLSKPVKISAYVRPVCLPDSRDEIEPGTVGYITGWGQANGLDYPNILQETTVQVINTSVCNESYMNIITDSMLCAGYPEGGHDICTGDSGGPLVIESPVTGRYILRGITSFGGTPCGRPNQYGVYSNVSSYLDWIIENIKY